nr:MAG TPA: hypothetical protein [Caudoviricetes sp.]
MSISNAPLPELWWRGAGGKGSEKSNMIHDITRLEQ